MKKLLALIFTLFVIAPAWGQGDMSFNPPPLLGNTGTANPAACQVGRLFFRTDLTAGQNIQLCTAANTWSAGTVATNANLTGPIASTGNTTTVTAQTGTGTTFVMQASPTLTTPNIGAATGTSINFGGTTLSTYTEGTWTPTLAGTGGSITNTLQVGHYTRIGRTVFAQYYVSGTKNTGTGPLSITGLPFASKNTANVYHNAPVATWANAGGTAFVNMSTQVAPATTAMPLYAITAASANSQTVTVNATDISSAFNFLGTITYQTD